MNHLHAALQERAQRAAHYFAMRGERPELPARIVYGYVSGQGEPGDTLDEHACAMTTGHDFRCTGTEYGGDDERWHGEGRCLCVHCGKDGDG